MGSVNEEGGRGFEQVPVVRVVISGRRNPCASLQGTCAAQSYSMACGLVREYFPAVEVLVPR